jgi:RNA polymerase sigma factor (sigma-70 family)
MNRPPDLHLQALLAEEPFVRALACALAAHDADDVAQQTWLIALQRRGPVHQPRSWLRRIATNVAANLARGDRHRMQRERAAAARERVPSSAELMEREERRGALVRAVDRLPVDLREVVLLRWFEGLPPHRIAAELGLPPSTVWNRLRSALQRLRQRLDQEHDGDRRVWLLPLLPVRTRPAAPALPLLLAGVSTMTTKT